MMLYQNTPPQVKIETVEDAAASVAPEEESLTVTLEPMEEEVLEEEHLYEDLEGEELEGKYEVGAEMVGKDALPNKKGKPIVEHTNSGIELKSQNTSDSEEEQDTTPKYVYSWKELYQPKQPKSKAVTRKIQEYLPPPKFVPHTCYVCNTSYEDSDGLDTHLEGHVGLLPYKCEACSTEQLPQIFKTLITLNRHMQSHLYPFKCDYCPIRLLKMPTYEQHMRRYHGYQQEGDGFTCDHCGQHFQMRKLFLDHIAKHRALDEGRYKCEHCGKAFCSNTLLVRHRRIHTGEKPFECKKCGKKFNHRDNFKNHMRIHINEKGYVCTECGKSFANSPGLRYHMAEHFPDDPNYRPQPQAQKSFMRSRFGENAESKRNNSGERIFHCKIEDCDYVTTAYSSFFYHKSMHEKKFQCDQCDKRFHMNHALQRHVSVVHKGVQPEKSHNCQYCGKLFHCKTKLRVHMDIHENIRRHKCQYCEKTFVQKNNLTAHERIHSGDRPYPCRVCSAVFITSSRRSKHERTHREGGTQASKEEDEGEELEDIIEEELGDEAIDPELIYDPE